jgi:hypothetical protein
LFSFILLLVSFHSYRFDSEMLASDLILITLNSYKKIPCSSYYKSHSTPLYLLSSLTLIVAFTLPLYNLAMVCSSALFSVSFIFLMFFQFAIS